jgi:hypothetical protein
MMIMKKFILAFLVVALTVVSAYSQKVTLGPKIGYSASKLSTNLPDIEESVKHNFMAGLFLRLGNKVYFQPELVYHTRGGVLDSAGFKQTVKLKNLDIPLMIGFKLLDLKIVNLRFMGGPVASFALDKEISYDDVIKDPLQSSDLKNVIWGLDVGLGLDVLFLTLDVRYEFGLNNIYEFQSGSYEMKNNLWIVGLGFKLF